MPLGYFSHAVCNVDRVPSRISEVFFALVVDIEIPCKSLVLEKRVCDTLEDLWKTSVDHLHQKSFLKKTQLYFSFYEIPGETRLQRVCA